MLGILHICSGRRATSIEKIFLFYINDMIQLGIMRDAFNYFSMCDSLSILNSLKPMCMSNPSFLKSTTETPVEKCSLSEVMVM